MGQDITLQAILDELRSANSSPLAIHVSGTVTYTIYPVQTVNKVSGYPVLRITEPSANQTYFDNGFITEADRAAGANGAPADTDLKSNAAGALLQLTNPTIIYG